MPIHNFRRREKLKPLVDVAFGATVPAGCKEHAIYAESPESDKCVSGVAGECPNIRKCKMARKNEKQLYDAGFKTRPTQLGFFMIPTEYRNMLNLPPRPTEIPGIVVISDHDVELEGIREPFDCLMRYPVFDYYLAWWKATECVCKGDGQKAELYPFSPNNPDHARPRACLYRDCPDFDMETKKKCKAVGELYFRLPSTPGYPGLWRVTTRSSTAIENIIMELERLHKDMKGVVSRVPLKLTLEKEIGRPVLNGKQMLTEVYRIHIRTDITMDQADDFKSRLVQRLAAGNEMKLIKAKTPELPPPPMPPVEELATAPVEEWDDEQAEAQAVEHAQAGANTAAPAKPAQAAAQARSASVPAQVARPAVARPAAVPAQAPAPTPQKPTDPFEEARRVELEIIRELKGLKHQGELDAMLPGLKQTFSPYRQQGFAPTEALNVVKQLRSSLPKAPRQSNGPMPAPAASAPAPAKQAAPAEVPAQAAKPKKVHAENDPGKLRRKIRDFIEQGFIDSESMVVGVVNTMRENQKIADRAQSIDGFLVEEMQEIIRNLES